MLHLRNERDGRGGPLPPRGVPGATHELALEALYIPSPHLIGRLALTLALEAQLAALTRIVVACGLRLIYRQLRCASAGSGAKRHINTGRWL